VQPGFGRQDYEMVAQVPRDGVQCHLRALVVDAVHPLQVSRKRTLGDERSQALLVESRRVPVGVALGHDKRITRPIGGHDAAEAQCREETLGERADAEHTSVTVLPQRRVQRSASALRDRDDVILQSRFVWLKLSNS
jgi:hypothetical protein